MFYRISLYALGALCLLSPLRASGQELGDKKRFGWGVIHDGQYMKKVDTLESGECDLCTGACPGGSSTDTYTSEVTWDSSFKIGGAYFVEAGINASEGGTESRSCSYTIRWNDRCSNCKPCVVEVIDVNPVIPVTPDGAGSSGDDGGSGGEGLPGGENSDDDCVPDDPCLRGEYRVKWKKGECTFGAIGKEAGCGGRQHEEHGVCIKPPVHIFQIQDYEQWTFRQHMWSQVGNSVWTGYPYFSWDFEEDWVPVPGDCRDHVVDEGVRTVGTPRLESKNIDYGTIYRQGLVELDCWCTGDYGNAPVSPMDEPEAPGGTINPAGL